MHMYTFISCDDDTDRKTFLQFILMMFMPQSYEDLVAVVHAMSLRRRMEAIPLKQKHAAEVMAFRFM